MKKFLSVEEVSEILKYTPKYIYNLKSQGKLKGIKKGHKLLFTSEEIEVYRESISQSSPSSSSQPHVNYSETRKTVVNEAEERKENEVRSEHITLFPDEQDERKLFFPGEKGNEFLISISSYREGTWQWIDEYETTDTPSGAQIKAAYGTGKYRLTVSRKTREGWKFFGRHTIDIGLRPDEIKREDEITILQKQIKELGKITVKLESERINLEDHHLTLKDNIESFKTDYTKDTTKIYRFIESIIEILESHSKMNTETLLPVVLTTLRESMRRP